MPFCEVEMPYILRGRDDDMKDMIVGFHAYLGISQLVSIDKNCEMPFAEALEKTSMSTQYLVSS
jgi:hypothetical protein